MGAGKLIGIYVEERSRVQGRVYHCPRVNANRFAIFFLLRTRSSKCLLGCVDHVQEAVFISLALVDLRNGSGHRYHAVTVDKQEESLVGVELEASPIKTRNALAKCFFVCFVFFKNNTKRDKRQARGKRLYLIILISSLMFTWSGTKNLVLSRIGSCFSPLYLSMMT